MHLVDDINLIFLILRRILDCFPQVTNFINAVVAGSIDFHHIQAFLIQQTLTAFAAAAGIAVIRMFAINGTCHNLGG